MSGLNRARLVAGALAVCAAISLNGCSSDHSPDAPAPDASAPAPASTADYKPTVQAMKPDQAQAFISLLDGSIQGAAKSQAAGDAAMTQRFVQTIAMASGNAIQLWPDTDISGTGNPQVMAIDNMENPTRSCRAAAIDAGQWWDQTVSHATDQAAQDLQSYKVHRDSCLKGAPHFDSWLKKVKAEKASEYTVKTSGSKPPHPRCLEVVDIEAPSGSPHVWTCNKPAT